MSKKILGIGNAIVDVFVKVDDDFLLKNNLTKGSMKLIEKQEFESLKSTQLRLKKLKQVALLQIPWRVSLILEDIHHL
jgi:sugar/nucleoside kinase (ribokinase family)